MADKKISELTSITGANVSDANDTIAIVDSSAGQTKKITRGELFKDVDGAGFTGPVEISENVRLVATAFEPLLSFSRGATTADFTLSTSPYLNIDINNVAAARVDEAGTTADNPLVVITREKGDVRYLPERGSNANGEYVRFPDGTQICTHALASASSGDTTWTYPASFDGSPSISFQPISAGVRFATSTARTASTANFKVYDDSGTQRAQTVECIAIGAWS